MTWNLNDHAYVRLTPLGEYWWNHYWHLTHPLGVPEATRIAATQSNGEVHFHLWELMNIFGIATFIGRAPVFIENNIRLVSDREMTQAFLDELESKQLFQVPIPLTVEAEIGTEWKSPVSVFCKNGDGKPARSSGLCQECEDEFWEAAKIFS